MAVEVPLHDTLTDLNLEEAAVHPASSLTTLPTAHTSIAELQPGLADVIRRYIVNERRRNFAFLDRYDHSYMNGEMFWVELANEEAFRPHNGHRKAEFQPSLRAPLGSQLYIFGQSMGAHYTVPLRLAPEQRGERIDIHDIQVQWNNEWSRIVEWLKDQYENQDEDYAWRKFPDIEHEQHQKWWKYNGKHFHLLELPAELRNLIYLYSLGPILIPRLKHIYNIVGDLHNENFLTLGIGSSTPAAGLFRRWKPITRGFNALDDPPVGLPNINLLFVSKQVSREALDAVWLNSTIRFESESQFTEARSRKKYLPLCKFVAFAPACALNNIQFNFAADAYFRLVGIKPSQSKPWKASTSDLYTLQTLKELKIRTLDLRFMSPKHKDARDPWVNALHPDGIGNRHSCQKIWIDWFLTFLLPHLQECKGIKRVTLSGCIKNSTRLKWEQILRDKDTLLVDAAQTIAGIQAHHTMCKPILCHCLKPCPRRNLRDDCNVEAFSYED